MVTPARLLVVVTLVASGCGGAQAPVAPAPSRGAAADADLPVVASPCEADGDCGAGLECARVCSTELGVSPAGEECDGAQVEGFCRHPVARRALDPRELLFAFAPRRGDLHAMVRGDPEDEGPGGELDVLAWNEAALVAGRALESGELPADIAALSATRWRLHPREAAPCTSAAAHAWLLGLEPLDAADESERRRRVARTDLYYAGRNGGFYFTLRLDAPCEGALWGRDIALPEVPAAAAQAVSPAERERALAAFRALLPYGILQASFESRDRSSGEGEPVDAWTEYGYGGGRGPFVRAFELGGVRRVVVAAERGSVCWGWVGGLIAVFRERGDGWRAESASIERGDPLDPAIALDLDGDGLVELIEADGTAARLWSVTLETPSAFRTPPATSGC